VEVLELVVVVVVGQLVGTSIQLVQTPVEQILTIEVFGGANDVIYPPVKLAAGTCVSKGFT
jgi:hypothetical protein